MNDQQEEAYADGIDEACRQVNEYLSSAKTDFRFINAGLNTVCKVGAGDPDFARWQEFCEKRRVELYAAWKRENEVPREDINDPAEAGLT